MYIKGYRVTAYRIYSWLITGVAAIILLSNRPIWEADAFLVAVLGLLLCFSFLASYVVGGKQYSGLFAVLITISHLLHLTQAIWLVTLLAAGYRIIQYLNKQNRSVSYLMVDTAHFSLLFFFAHHMVNIVSKSRIGSDLDGGLLKLLVTTMAFFLLHHLIIDTFRYLRQSSFWSRDRLVGQLKWNGYLVMSSVPIIILMLKAHEIIGPAGLIGAYIPLFFLTKGMKVYANLLETNTQLEQIYENSQLIDSLNVKDAVSRILDECNRIVAYDAGAIFFYNQKDQVLELVSHRGEAFALFDEQPLPVSQGISGWVAKTGKARVSDDYSQDVLAHHQLLAQADIQSVLAVPLLISGEVIGVLTLSSETLSHFEPDSAKALTVLGYHAAIALRNAQRYEITRRQANVDALTGLYNYAFFVQSYDEQIAAAKQKEENLTIVILDIDHFKKFNDTYGHQVGNELLRQLASVILTEVRASDTVYRFGGEEFIVTLPDCTVEAAAVVAERLRKTIEETEFSVSGTKELLSITVSMGLAEFPNDAIDPQELIQKADLALYKGAKEQGRNTLGLYQLIDEQAMF